MFRLLHPVSVVALLAAVVPLSAAPRPEARPGGPAVVGQAKSLHDLLEMTKTLVKNVGGDQLYREFEKEALPRLDPKQLPGIDARRPFGLYGHIDADLTKCRAVVLVPITGDRPFLDMLNQFGLQVNPGKEAGTFAFVTPPDVPFPVVGRFHKGYAYIALGGADVLDPKVILDPKDVINDREKAAAYLALRLDRVPPDSRRALLALFRERTEPIAEEIREPELKVAFQAARRLALRWLNMLAEEGREIVLRLDADTRTGDVTLAMDLDGMSKSPLSQTIARRGPTKNAFASLVGDDYAYRIYVSAPLFAEEAQEALTKLIEYGEKAPQRGAARGAAPEGVALVAALCKSLKATVATGDMDLAAAIRGPNKAGFFTAVGAVHCQEGAQLEKAIREAVKVLPAQTSGYFKFDAGKIGKLSVHEIDLSTEATDIAQKVFGNGQKAYFTFGKDALYVSYGPDGMEFLKEAVEAKAGPAPVFDNSSNPKRAAELVKRLLPPGGPNGPAIRFGAMERLMTGGTTVTVDGGDRLKVRVRLNLGSMFLFGFSASAAEARPVAQPPVAVPVPPAKK